MYVAVAADSDSSLLDRERLAVHQVALVVVDGGGHRADAQLVVSLSDVNDHRPQMTRSHYEGYLRENDNHLERPLHVEVTDSAVSGFDKRVIITLMSLLSLLSLLLGC